MQYLKTIGNEGFVLNPFRQRVGDRFDRDCKQTIKWHTKCNYATKPDDQKIAFEMQLFFMNGHMLQQKVQPKSRSQTIYSPIMCTRFGLLCRMMMAMELKDYL